MLVALDIETSGLIPGWHEVLQIAVIPLREDFEWQRDFRFFDHYLRPEYLERVDTEAIRVMSREDTSLDYGKVVTRTNKFEKYVNEGLEQTKVADLFVDWFEKLGLKPKKRLLPVGHNLQFDMAFIKAWLGPDAYEYIFDSRHRDTQTISLFWNDVDHHHDRRCMFKDAKLASVCNSMKVENEMAHNAFDDALATARCYGRMVKQFNMSASVIPMEQDAEELKQLQITRRNELNFDTED